MRISRGTFVSLSVILVLLVAARVALPHYLTREVNNRLANLEGPFCGSVKDIDLQILLGSYEIEGIQLNSRENDPECKTEILSVEEVNLDISWSELFRGNLRLDVELDFPRLALDPFLAALNASKKASSEASDGANEAWGAMVPWRIASLRIEEGEIYLKLFGKEGGSAVAVGGIEAEVTGIESGKREGRPILFRARGNLLGDAQLLVTGALDLAAEPARWDVDFSAEKTNLTKANEMLYQRVPLTFTTGRLDAYGEAQGQGQRMAGYTKLLFSDIDVVAPKEDWKNFQHGLMEILNSLAFLVLESPRVDNTGTIIEFSRTGAGFEIDIGKAVARALEHRMGNPVPPGVEKRLELANP